MEKFNTSEENRLNDIINRINMNLNFSFLDFYDWDISDPSLVVQIIKWMNWLTIAIGLPLIIMVMIAVFIQVKKGQDAPVYVINLLVSDLIQFGCRIPINPDNPCLSTFIFLNISFYAFMVSVGFMVCISCERYLVVAKPLWYRFRRNIKTYVVVCIVVWILPIFSDLLTFLTNILGVFRMFFFLLPVPLLTFFLVGTIKALSGALNIPADEKRRITAIQVVVLINYTLLYLPIIFLLLQGIEVLHTKLGIFSTVVTLVCFYLSPLADTTLYVLSRKSFMDKFLASICSCKTSSNLEMRSTDYESRTATNTETV